MDERTRVHEIIVVEGLHDKQAIDSVVSADVWILGGDRIARTVLDELRRASLRRGVIVFTDPDGPGERIRRRVDDAIPGCKHAFLSRESATSSQGIGVEHASKAAILQALADVRISSADTASPLQSTQGDLTPRFTLQDLQETGLANHPRAAKRRQKVGEILSIGYGNAKAFVRKLNALEVSRDEWEGALRTLEEAKDE